MVNISANKTKQNFFFQNLLFKEYQPGVVLGKEGVLTTVGTHEKFITEVFAAKSYFLPGKGNLITI